MLEDLAELMHDNWASWAKALMLTERLSPERVARWEECLVAYEDLPEKYKEKSRLMAKEILYTVDLQEEKND